jgi:hypothetical protein
VRNERDIAIDANALLASEIERQKSSIDELKADNERLNQEVRALKDAAHEKERTEELGARENEVLQQPGWTTNHERPDSDREDDNISAKAKTKKAIDCPPHVPPSFHFGSAVRQVIKEEEVERILTHSFQLTQSATGNPIPAAALSSPITMPSANKKEFMLEHGVKRQLSAATAVAVHERNKKPRYDNTGMHARADGFDVSLIMKSAIKKSKVCALHLSRAFLS